MDLGRVVECLPSLAGSATSDNNVELTVTRRVNCSATTRRKVSMLNIRWLEEGQGAGIR